MPDLKPTHLFFLILTFFWGSPALAASIVNLDDKPHVFDIVDCHCDNYHIVLPPSMIWRTPGRVRINYEGNEISLGERDEYAIWKNQGLGPQRRTRLPVGIVK